MADKPDTSQTQEAAAVEGATRLPAAVLPTAVISSDIVS